MKHPVRLERSGDVASIIITNPPVNALGGAVRRGVMAALNAALADDKARAIVIAANGRTFPVGADIAEFDAATKIQPHLRDLCDRIEASSKPVIAAIHGTTFGGGLELAMAAHYRIADPDTQCGLPEIKLGLLPGAGGTQRLPRLVGAEAALDMMLSGNPIATRKAYRIGLIDRIAKGDLRQGALEFAGEMEALRVTSTRRDSMADGASYMKTVNSYRTEVAKQFGKALAPAKIVECVEAALLVPYSAGAQMEAEAFDACLASRASKGLRHAFFAERRAAKFTELQDATAAEVDVIGIVGGGLMGAGIAIACFDAGLDVVLVEQDDQGVNTTLERIGKHYERAVKRGRMSEAAASEALNHLTLTTRMDKLKDADVIIEAITEDRRLKQDALRAIGEVAKDDAIIATNTSYLNTNSLAASSGRPDRFLGLHFFAPADRMRLVEIVIGHATSNDAVATVHGLVRKLGKLPVRSGVAEGFIANRILVRMRLVADAMLEDGAQPAQIDTAMRAFGFAQGPYQVLDRVGLNIAWSQRKLKGRNSDLRYVEIGDKMCEKKWFGRKSGKGYYLYDSNGKQGYPNPDVLSLIGMLRADKEIEPRSFTDREIRDRILLAIVNEAAHLLDEGIASRPSDIDCVMVHGHGYPRKRGGPMLDADLAGLFTIARKVEELEEEDPSLWKIAPLLKRMGLEREKFGDLN